MTKREYKSVKRYYDTALYVRAFIGKGKTLDFFDDLFYEQVLSASDRFIHYLCSVQYARTIKHLECITGKELMS